MLFKIAIAIGAGLASALLFFIPVKGTTFAMVLALVGPLPIMIAALGFGTAVGFAAACIGTIAIAISLHPLISLFFALSLGIPAFWLAHVAARRHLVTLPDGSDTIEVPAYSSGQILTWIAVLAALTALVPIAVLAARDGAIATSIDDLARQLAPVVRRLFGGESNIPNSMSAREFSRLLVLAMPALIAAWGVITLSFNLWLAGKIARISGLMPAVETDLPYRLRLSRDCVWILGAAIVASTLGETPRFIASTMVAAFATAFSLHGLAVIHGYLRNNVLRTGLLCGLYVLIFMTAWPLLFAGAVGLLDSLVPLKRHPQPPPAAV